MRCRSIAANRCTSASHLRGASTTVALLFAVFCSACANESAQQQRAAPTPPSIAASPSPGAGAQALCPCGPEIVDPSLLAFLSKARAAHHEADLHEADKQQALLPLERLVDGAVPGADSPPPEAREVLADTHARIADLKSELGDFDGAAKHVEAGLRLAPAPSYFQGHLFEMRGLVEERRADALRRAGDVRGAEASKRSAIQAFQQAIRVQDAVIDKALRDGGAAPQRSE